MINKSIWLFDFYWWG